MRMKVGSRTRLHKILVVVLARRTSSRRPGRVVCVRPVFPAFAAAFTRTSTHAGLHGSRTQLRNHNPVATNCGEWA